MKRMFFLCLLMPMLAIAKTEKCDKSFTIRCVVTQNGVEHFEEGYSDSIVNIDVSSGFRTLAYINFSIDNKTDHRIVVEWENMRIRGNKIAFSTDRIFEMNRPREDEVILAGESLYKELYLRSDTFIPVLYAKYVKKGPQYLDIIVPIKDGDKIYDIKTKWIVSYE